MHNPLSVASAARRICERSGWRISNLELQKILYMAHLVYMGRTGTRLIDDTFEAWDYGPVSPRLYRRVKMFGSDPIRDVFFDAEPIPDGHMKSVIDEACDRLLGKSPGGLVAMTHWWNGAWAKNYVPGAYHVPIPDDDIVEEYRKRTNAIRR